MVLGGFGPSGGTQSQWRSMWDAFKQYGDGGRPPKEEFEKARGCNYYSGDCHALTIMGSSHDGSTSADASEPQWEKHDFGSEVCALVQGVTRKSKLDAAKLEDVVLLERPGSSSDTLTVMASWERMASASTSNNGAER